MHQRYHPARLRMHHNQSINVSCRRESPPHRSYSFECAMNLRHKFSISNISSLATASLGALIGFEIGVRTRRNAAFFQKNYNENMVNRPVDNVPPVSMVSDVFRGAAGRLTIIYCKLKCSVETIKISWLGLRKNTLERPTFQNICN
jgi:hypothetical protein